ncbi:hypothetical protein BC941DRAFT_409584 [Chlamydoabsidia padenii]|nr:hypothetical protein BC941DRAFT_409584 [Chlamydoabsidia padenii]
MSVTEPSLAETLLQDLSSETILTEYYNLKAQYDERVKHEQQLQLDLDQTRTLLDEARRATTLYQQDKELLENKLVNITNNKHESEALVSELRQSMALLRSDNTKLSQDNKEYYTKVIKIQSEKDAEHYQNETLKLQVTDLHQKLNNAMKNEENSRQAWLVAESEIKLQSESQRRQYEQIQSQKCHLEKERDSLLATIQDLRQQVTRYKTDMDCAVDKATTAEDRLKKSESNRVATMKNYQDLLDLYEKQRLEAEGKIANFSADLDSIQQKAVTKQSKLEQENSTLREQLVEANDRLQVVRTSLDKLAGKKDAPGSSSPSSPHPDTTTSNTPILSTSLLKMMKQYEHTGRHWDDIYTDFFQLRDNTTRLTAINAELKAINKQLFREQENYQRYQAQLESELERLREECKSSSVLEEDFTKLKTSSTQEIFDLKNKVDDLQHKNNNLNATVNDTTYQLCYLLRHVECQYGTLPIEVQHTHNLLSNAHIPSTLSHEKTIFKDIADLLQRNQDLMTDVRQLGDQLHEKTNEAASYAIAAKDNNSLLDENSAKYKSLERDQDEKLQVLQTRLSRTITERDQLAQQLSETSSGSSIPTNSMALEEERQLAEQKCQDLAAELDTCRQEMETELDKQRQEMDKINSEAMVIRQDYNNLQKQVDLLERRNKGLVEVSSARATEIDDLRSCAALRERHLGEVEGRLSTLTNDIMIANRTLETLRNDYTSVSAQLKASDASYQRLLLENKELAIERVNLTTLLQNMNDSLGSSTSGTTHLVEELKQHNERLSRELQNLRDTLAAKEKEIRGYQAIDPQEWKDKYQITSGELKQLKTTYLELEKQLATANQDRIVAQTKLMESLQNTSTYTSDNTNSNNNETTVSDQAQQLADANNQIMSLKKDLFIFKERLADTDATANRITAEYNKFASESQARIDTLSDDLAASNEKVDSLQKVISEQKEAIGSFSGLEQQWETTKATLLQENEQLGTKVAAVSQQIADLQVELNTNVQQLQQSEERYQAEVAARAQDANVITGLRDEIQRLNVDISTSRSEVVGANDRLRSAEISYRNQKEQLEITQNDMKLRLDESQKQQESLSALIQELLTKINELRTNDDVDNDTISHLAENATSQLRDVSASLRREKDIWQARHTDAQQRADRLESDLEFVQHQLSTTRALLESVRAEKDQTAQKQLQGIKDARNEATLYKEHNASLRSDMEKLLDRVNQLETLVADKENQVEPLALKAKGLELELAQTKAFVQTLESRQAQWSARSARLLSKHNISDPQELDDLKGELETAKAQLDEKTKSLDALEKQHQEVVAKTSQIEETLKKTTEVANQRGKLAYEFKKKAADLEESVKKLREQQTSEQQKPQQEEQQQGPETSQKIKELEDAYQKQKDEHTALSTKYTNLLNKARQLNTEKRRLEPLKQEKIELTAQLDSLKTEIDQLKQQLATKTEETSSLQMEIGRMKAMQSMITNKNDKLKKEIEKLQGSPSKPLTASAPPFVPSSDLSTTESTGDLKRPLSDDLDGQPPQKKVV